MSTVIVNILKERCEERSKLKLCFGTVYHCLHLIVYCFIAIKAALTWSSLTEEQLENVWMDNAKRFSACYLTKYSFIFQSVFLFLSFVHDVLEWMNRNETWIAKKIKYYRDLIFCGLVVPYSLFVSSMFWTIFWIDRELVFPKVYDEVVPWWFNQCVHTNITVVVVVETLLYARRHPVNRKIELIMNAAVGIIYAVIYYSIYFFTDRWLYGVFGIMTWWQVCLYQLLVWCSTAIFYYIQFPINRLFHKEVIEPQKSNGVTHTANEFNRSLPNPEMAEKPQLSTDWTLKDTRIGQELDGDSNRLQENSNL